MLPGLDGRMQENGFPSGQPMPHHHVNIQRGLKFRLNLKRLEVLEMPLTT